jgi:hypothetical protein
MPYKTLWIFVEGDDDVRFFERVMKPSLTRKYDRIQIWRYAQEKKEKVKSFLRSIRKMNAGYIYTTDINDTPSVTAKKQKVQSKFGDIDKDRIMVVEKEIESWYLAGVDDTCSRKLGISPPGSTDSITKEQFNALIPRRFDGSRIDFMEEILRYFNIETAKQKNESFRYFLDNYNCAA